MRKCIKCGDNPVIETTSKGVRVYCKKCGNATEYAPIYTEASAQWDIMNRAEVKPLVKPKRRTK